MPDARLLTRGSQAGVAIGSGATVFLDGQNGAGDPKIWCGGDATLVVEVDMTGAAATDLSVEVNPYEADNATPQLNQILPAAADPAGAGQGGAGVSEFVGGHCYVIAQYDVQGYEMVRVAIKNNNAGAQTISRGSWRLQ